MKLTKTQTRELRNCHNGIGFVVVKLNDDTLRMCEFYTDKKGDVRFNTNTLNPPILDLKEFVKNK